MTPQATLSKSSIPVTGPGLDEDAPATVRFHPAAPDSGVVFVRADLAGEPRVECRIENMATQARWSALEAQGVVVHHTEHVLAALVGCGVDNVLVECSADRIPVVTGGSCAGFIQALQDAGTQTQDRPRTVFRLTRALHSEAALDVPAGAATAPPGRRYIVGIPASHFAATYTLHVPAISEMRVGLCEFDQSRDDFRTAIGHARTYYLNAETANLAGMLSSARREYIVLDAHSPQALVDEAARHKTLDFLGDLMLLGRPLLGRFAAFRTGHRFHHDLLRKLLTEGYLEMVALDNRGSLR